jgi:hypothetical protein
VRPFTENEYQSQVALVLEGLVPIAWLDRVGARCDNPRAPTVQEMWPDPVELEGLVETLAMADTLAAGGAVTKKEHEHRAKSLTALAKCVVILSLVPGGVKFLGTWWRAVPLPQSVAQVGGAGVYLMSGPVDAATPVQTPAVGSGAIEAMRRAILDGLDA